ncbi:hypothetical protein DPMN_135285 [Dreissena polymorpha]|uniref:Uncharacterized protein n=1 Tax=Dreissena polymorpha TaxID=45954 RepID=A0A9D4G1L6_DREPO|nr:hypothetical protein DPMN_135285 [Dreissena polymorpha]
MMLALVMVMHLMVKLEFYLGRFVGRMLGESGSSDQPAHHWDAPRVRSEAQQSTASRVALASSES